MSSGNGLPSLVSAKNGVRWAWFILTWNVAVTLVVAAVLVARRLPLTFAALVVLLICVAFNVASLRSAQRSLALVTKYWAASHV